MTSRHAKWTILRLLTAVALVAATAPARADNLADEAELQFELGADRYKASDFRGALEHFLASNRLVPNRNVVFNIARTYEQLKQSADAYRYFNQALEGETDAPTRARIEEAIARTLPLIAVVRIESDPPGATVYIGRRELGPRGNTPLVLGLTPGSYKVMAELPGYEPVEAAPQDFAAGTKKTVSWPLKQIVGGLYVDGTPQGAAVRIDEQQGRVQCTLPCSTEVPPGRHTVFVTAPGHQAAAASANVVVGSTAMAHVELTAVTRTLLVVSDPPGALVTADGKPEGFTPAALALSLGPHSVVVTRAGYRPFERTVDVTPEGQARVDADLTPVEEVTAASRVTETVEDAPSSVSIITAQELRAMGYSTIAEAVRGVRGVYVGDDTSYSNVGFRGFAPLGDYGDHVLVLVDGQPTNDNYVGSSYIGYDARADIDDIERIEVVRGPGSALYGTGAFFGVINLVTRNRDAPTHGEIATSTADASVGRARATAQVRFSPDSGGWVSVAGAHGAGRDFFFPEYASDPATGGNARGVDGFQTGTVNGRVWYKSLTLQWLLTSRDKTLPSGEFATVFGDPRTRFVDTRGLVELRFEPVISSNVQLMTRAHANLYNFDDFLPATPENGGVLTESFRGDWVGLEQRIVVTPVPALRLTVGGEVQDHVQAQQYGVTTDTTVGRNGNYLNQNNPFFVGAGYLVGDITPGRALKLSLGTRYDYFSNFGSSVNPRAAVIIRPYAKGILKIMGGTAFRAPSIYEHFYQSPTQIPGDTKTKVLDPESVYSGEIELTHRFTSTISGVVAGYTNYVKNLIELEGSGTVQDPNQYRTLSNPVQTYGVEAEVRREWRNGVMIGATYAYQHTGYLGDTKNLREVPNSPNHLASVKAAAPIVGSMLVAMTRLSFQGPRFDKYDRVTDPAQGTTPAAAIWDVVLSGEAVRYGVRYALGLYNAMDYRYSVPVSKEFVQTSMVQPGRTVLLSTQVSF
jgi:outer membrane receptor for ferrienterochelin and colicin